MAPRGVGPNGRAADAAARRSEHADANRPRRRPGDLARPGVHVPGGPLVHALPRGAAGASISSSPSWAAWATARRSTPRSRRSTARTFAELAAAWAESLQPKRSRAHEEPPPPPRRATDNSRALLCAQRRRARRGGILTASRGKLRRLFCLQKGWIVYATSNLIEEQFVEYLVRTDAISPRVYTEADRRVREGEHQADRLPPARRHPDERRAPARHGRADPGASDLDARMARRRLQVRRGPAALGRRGHRAPGPAAARLGAREALPGLHGRRCASGSGPRTSGRSRPTPRRANGERARTSSARTCSRGATATRTVPASSRSPRPTKRRRFGRSTAFSWRDFSTPRTAKRAA